MTAGARVSCCLAAAVSLPATQAVQLSLPVSVPRLLQVASLLSSLRERRVTEGNS